MGEKEMEKLLQIALAELRKSVSAMYKQTTPYTSFPRPRVFKIAPGITWPHIEKNRIYWSAVSAGEKEKYISDRPRDNQERAEAIVQECKGQPRLILRALRRIQAATAWCQARAEGRQKMAEEILRQQSKAVEALEAEIALLSLQK